MFCLFVCLICNFSKTATDLPYHDVNDTSFTSDVDLAVELDTQVPVAIVHESGRQTTNRHIPAVTSLAGRLAQVQSYTDKHLLFSCCFFVKKKL